MDFILANLTGNKVTLDIKTNSYEECYDYSNLEENKFENIENIFDLYKTLSKPSKTIREDQKFVYVILCSIDETLSLIQDKQIFIDKFMEELNLKLENYAAKLKKYGYDKKEVFEKKEALYYYVGILLNKTILLKDKEVDLYEIYGSMESLYVDLNTLTFKNLTIEEGKMKYWELKKQYYLNQNLGEKLNDLLVKDLKTIAEEIGLDTYKIENGKKKNLLKAELKEIIKVKLYSVI